MTRFLAVVLLLLLAGISGNGQRGESGAGAVRRLNREILEAARARRSSGAALPPRLQTLLRERAAHWRQLAAEDPRSALEAVLPAADRLALSSQGGAGLIESTGEWSGEFERWTADDFDQHTDTEFFGLRANGQTLRLYFAPGGAPPAGCGGALRVKGARLGNVAAVREATLERPAAGCLRTGEQRVAAILVNLPGARLPSNVTNASVRSLLFGSGATLDAYWREASYGRAWATGNVFGPYDLNLSYQCNGNDILNSVQPLLEAAIAAADPEADFRQYDRLMLVVPQQNFCNVGGFATLGCSTLSSADGAFQASRAFIRADAVNLHTFAHEAGHNLGLGHSGALYYAAEPLGTLGAAPAAEEYGNPWDVMGGATCGGSGLTGHYSSRHKFGLGWLQSSNLQSTASPGLYNLLPLEQSSTGVQTLRVRRGAGNDHWLWIEYRRPSGFDSSLQNCSAGDPFNGVLIHYEQPAYTGDNRTRLLDFGNSLALASNPARKAFAAALKAGQKWSDPYTQLSIEVLSAAESASLRISYDTPCATISPPSVSHAPPPQQGAVSVTAPGNCAVQAVSNDPAWITITGDTVFNGSRTLTYSLPDNPLPQRRTSSISVGRQTFIIVQEADNGQPAPVSVTPSSGGSAPDTPQRFRLAYTDSDGGVQLSEVSAVFNSFNSLVGGCYFAYFPGDRMLRLYGDDGGSWSSWTIGAARTLANSQCSLNVATATATVQGAILELAVDVTFAAPFSGSKEVYLAAKDLRGADSGRTLLGHWTAGAATCAVSGAASAASFPSGGGSGSFQISANLSSCPWSINGLPAWITVNPTSGSGPATVAFNVTANSGAARSATLNVAGNSVTIGQAAAACAVSATSSTTGFGPGGGSGAVQIASNLSTCSWSIAGAPSWITLSRTGGTGPASAAFTVAANSGPSRSATLSVAGASITITQSAAACVLSASATLTSFGPAAASATFQIGSNLSTCAWSISGAPAWITLNQSSGTGPASVGFTIAANPGAARGATLSVAGASIAISQSAAAPAVPSGLRFVPVTPCRAADTRQGSGKSGSLGPPSLTGGTSRTLPMPNAGCGLPATAKAYAVNVTVVPRGPLGFLTTWPTGSARPLVSTLNSFEGGVVANSAIVPAGVAGSIDVYVTDTTDLILDVNGYFTDQPAASNLVFYPVPPCRLMDTRPGQGATGAFGPPSFPSNGSRSIPVPQGRCAIPTRAQAYALNFTVVPAGPLGFLSAWPTGQSQPLVSTLNSFEGRVVANGAIVPAGTGGAIQIFVTDPTDLIVDINGYFAPDDGNGLYFHTLAPCRAVDTRAGLGALTAAVSRSFTLTGVCGAPQNAGAYSTNVTAIPTAGSLGFLTAWATGAARPLVSTLNSFDGRVTANAALVPAGTGGAVSLFATDPTHVIVDLNGYFRR